MADFSSDMKKSMSYVKQNEDIIKRLLNGGETLTVEGSDDEVCRMLDITCGVDYFQIYESKDRRLVWGVASRMQGIDPYRRPYNTFTIRNKRESGVKTEYEKRRDAIRNNGVYPYLTMQGFVDKQTSELMSLAIAKTTDIMEYIENGWASVKHTRIEQNGQAEFYVVSWADFQRKGYPIQLYDKTVNEYD